MKPSEVREKYPQFAYFSSTNFAGALRNSRARANKDVNAHNEHDALGGKSKSFLC
jgi:hypothetical protein